MRTTIDLGGRTVGDGMPCAIVAEAGVNHNGDLALALQLVDAAADVGADFVKFQLFRAAEVASASAPKAEYQVATTGAAESQLEMLESLELPMEAFGELREAARARGIGFLCTTYSTDGLEYLHSIGVDGFKFASAQIVELPLIEHAAALGRPLIISTGMATLTEVDQAMTAAGGTPAMLLQCTTNYPSPVEESNLLTIPALAERFGVPVGYSDHTEGYASAIAAVALGSKLVEKHLTLDRSMAGPDHAASLDPGEFREFAELLRAAEASLGSSEKKPSVAEQANADVMRRSLHTARPVAAGALITADDVTFKRPNDGLPPSELHRVVGRRARVDIDQDTALRAELLD